MLVTLKKKWNDNSGIKIDSRNKRHNPWQQRKNWGNSRRYLNKNQKRNKWEKII